MAKTSDALKILDKLTGKNQRIRAGIKSYKINFEVAQMIYDARIKAGLSQNELANLIGSKQPVIARLEDANYEGHSLTMLQRIAEALGQQLQVRFKNTKEKLNKENTVKTKSRIVGSNAA